MHIAPGPRRVPGLRREELALLANVSPSYYARLEQGQPHQASPQVLDAIAAVLGLDGYERAHLHDLAVAARVAGPAVQPKRQRVPEEVRRLLAALTEVPAVLSGRRGDVLAWNALGHALLFSHLPANAPDAEEPPNLARQLFLDEPARGLFADWEAKGCDLVAHLRLLAGRHPEDAALVALVGELCVRSAAFARMWADHAVAPCTSATYGLRHSVVGDLTVEQQTVVPAGAPDLLLALVVPQRGASATAVGRLAASLAA